MSNYTKTTNFTAKDSLPSGDSGKVIRGSEFDTEFNAIATANATKADLASPTFTGTVTVPNLTITGNVVVDLGSADTVTIDGGTY
jgi:phage gp45-like|tara:strand:+ start:347 stop:601 length:255 start_codon:yes stop_codon:yes gene_type:complete